MAKSSSEPHDKLGPWKFRVGSAESRAAARPMLEGRRAMAPGRVLVLNDVLIPDEFRPKLVPTLEQLQREWRDAGDRYVQDKSVNGGVTVIRVQIMKDWETVRSAPAWRDRAGVAALARSRQREKGTSGHDL